MTTEINTTPKNVGLLEWFKKKVALPPARGR